MPTVTKNSTAKATESRPKGAQDTASKSKPAAKGNTAPVKSAKPVAPAKASSKTEAKTPGKTKASTKGKATTIGYKPVANSMRDFIFQALRRGGSAKKVKSRAASLAEKAGIDKFATVEAYKGFDVAFFVDMLKERGLEVEQDGNKYKLVA